MESIGFSYAINKSVDELKAISAVWGMQLKCTYVTIIEHISLEMYTLLPAKNQLRRTQNKIISYF